MFIHITLQLTQITTLLRPKEESIRICIEPLIFMKLVDTAIRNSKCVLFPVLFILSLVGLTKSSNRDLKRRKIRNSLCNIKVQFNAFQNLLCANIKGGNFVGIIYRRGPCIPF